MPSCACACAARAAARIAGLDARSTRSAALQPSFALAPPRNATRFAGAMPSRSAARSLITIAAAPWSTSISAFMSFG